MAHDPRISEIFYYFAEHTTIASGRTVGRKIGVVQEILCKKLILQSEKIRDSVIYEPKLLGHSGATHKVEFVLFQPLKCLMMKQQSSADIAPGLNVTIKAIDGDKVQLILKTASKKCTCTLEAGKVLASGVGREMTRGHGVLLKVPEVTAGAARIVALDVTRVVASIESKRVGAQRFSGSEQLGSGIQTIEKAKQASLVAIDFDLGFNGQLLTQGPHERKRQFRSFVILGNGVHWTDHDLRILATYVDYTYLAVDAAILRYAEFVRGLATKQNLEFFKFFMAYFNGMTKTPPDPFTVSAADFTPVRPSDAESLQITVERQIEDYPVLII